MVKGLKIVSLLLIYSGVCSLLYMHFSDEKDKTIYINEAQKVDSENINGYLLNAPNVFIDKRMKPLCDVPMIYLGGQPIDDGNLILTDEEKDELLKAHGFEILNQFHLIKIG